MTSNNIASAPAKTAGAPTPLPTRPTRRLIADAVRDIQPDQL